MTLYRFVTVSIIYSYKIRTAEQLKCFASFLCTIRFKPLEVNEDQTRLINGEVKNWKYLKKSLFFRQKGDWIKGSTTQREQWESENAWCWAEEFYPKIQIAERSWFNCSSRLRYSCWTSMGWVESDVKPSQAGNKWETI